MTADLQPYPEYKDSGLPWLGQVPVHWVSVPLCAVARPKAVINCQDRELLSVYLNLGVIRFSEVTEKRTNATSDNLSKYQAVNPGDFVLNNQQAWRGSVGVSKHSGIVSPAYLVLSLASALQPQFANYLFRDKAMVSQYLVCSKGVGSIQRNLYWPHLKRVTVLVPPLEEQVKAARFIEWKTAQTNRFIRNRRRLIEVLNEQKQAIINRAVTRGLDPNVPLKASGMPWVGEVPAHWNLVPNRGLLRAKKQVVGDNWAGFILLSLTKRGIIVRDLENPEGKFPASFDTYQIIEPGDFVFCLFDIDETPRTVGLSGLHGMITGAYTRFESLHPELSTFIYYYYLVMDFQKRLKPLYTGLRKVIQKGTFLSAKTPIPAKAEADKIVEHIQQQTEAIDTAVAKAQCEIDLIREYRTRLIADVVTGKVDVRDLAPTPGDEIIEAEDLDEGIDDEELLAGDKPELVEEAADE